MRFVNPPWLLWLVLCAPAAAADASRDAGSPLTVAPTTAHAPSPPIRGTLERGRDVFNRTCVKCHGNAATRAPLIGNERMWKPRIEQGLQTLVRHALEGHGGPHGMPPKGGFAELGNDDVAAAVSYIVSESRALAPQAPKIVAACRKDKRGKTCTPEMSRKYLLLYLFQGLSESHR